VQNAYAPAPGFATSCLITALPSDCTARIEPRQVNGIVSELTSLAECLDPNGPWNCASSLNLCTAFNTWKTSIVVTVTGPELSGNGTAGSPIKFNGVTTSNQLSGNGLSTSPLRLTGIDGGTY
jgi:hypothetical protein